MKIRIFAALTVLALTSLACSFSMAPVNIDTDKIVEDITTRIPDGIKGSGNLVTESYPVSGYDQVYFGGVGKLNLVQGDEEGVTLEIDDNLLPYVIVEVRGSTLHIEFEKNFTITNTIHVEFTVKVKDLKSLELAGFGDVQADQLQADDLSLTLSGAGNLEVDDLQAQSVDMRLSGFGAMRLQGQVESQNVTLSGAGDYQAGKLQSAKADVRLSGFGSATLWVTDELAVDLTGSGNLEYYGTPKVTRQNVDGFGRVQSLGSQP